VVKILFLGIVLGFALCNVSLQAEELLTVESVGMTVADMDRSIEFFSKVLSFEKVADVEVWGSDYERLQGVFGLRMRVVRMRLGDEFIELTEYLAPKGRPVPVDTRSYDRWFQHIAIIVNDMDRAYQWLRGQKVAHASTGPRRCPPGTRTRQESKHSISRTRTGTTSRYCNSPRTRVWPSGTRERTSSSWA